MKKISWGLYGIGLALLLTSCVAKKKYVEAQNKISQLEQQNADCVQKGENLNASLSALQQTNSDLQRRYDSTWNVYTRKQSTWNEYTTFYDKQRSTADQLHQQLHQQLDDKIGAMNIVLDNNKVYVTLPEATLFNSGSTSLSTKGKDIVNTLAVAIAQNPDVEVNVATSAVYPAMASSDMDMNSNASSNNSSDWNNSNSTTKVKTNGNTNADYANSSAKKQTNHTYHKKTNYSNSTAKKTSSTKYKSESTRHTMRSNYASNKQPAMSSNSMAVARASTIVTTLRTQGVAKAGIQVTDPVNKTSTSPRKYQVIVSPSMEGYNEMMGKSNIGTGMK